MKKYDTALKQIVEAPEMLRTPNGIKRNPSTADYEAAGLYDYVAFVVPEGHVAIDNPTYEVIDGVYHEIYNTMTVGDYEAQVAAYNAQQIQQQVAIDVAAFEDELANLAYCLTPFSIPSGADYDTVMSIMSGKLATCTPEQYQQLNILKDRADKIFERHLEPAGIINERLWLSLQALQEAAQ